MATNEIKLTRSLSRKLFIALEMGLPGKEVGHAELADKAVEILERRRAIDKEFFVRLHVLRGRRGGEIRRLEKFWFPE